MRYSLWVLLEGFDEHIHEEALMGLLSMAIVSSGKDQKGTLISCLNCLLGL